MKIENHILDILQLYEYAMAIGKSLVYKENCDSILKLILKRKHLNATWILKEKGDRLETTYSLPIGKKVSIENNENIKQFLKSIDQVQLIKTNQILTELAPIDIDNGYVAIYNLKDQGYLFLYTQKHNLSLEQLSQLQPVIDKFYNSLLACNAFEEQETLLDNLKLQNQELSDYAHMVSHDLKSPLRNIDTLTYWLKEDNEEKLGEEGQNQIDTIRTNVQKMETIISGILKYSTIGKNKTEFYPVNLDSLLKEVVQFLDIPTHIEIKLNNLPTVKGDKYHLKQLFQNMIYNAVKYNDKMNPKIEIGAVEKDGHYEFFIADNGIGIDKNYHTRIFDTFEKLENDDTSTGIGLSIVKKIINIYGGKIWLESELGEGTTFYFTLKNQN